MKRRGLLGAVLLAGLVLTTGCFKANSRIILERAGSGVFEISYAVAEQSVVQAKALLRIREEVERATGSGVTDMRDAYTFLDGTESEIRARLKRYEPFGITTETVTV
ncbi:MAG TPA: hypothetical protein PKY95_10215, partial [candidate division Zixibacteria bacterium]|nr:hypothetical protein [candidate division Zixibacteria bacterium]